MKVYLNSITGIDDAITSMYMSKRSWTRAKEEHIRKIVASCTDRNGKPYETMKDSIDWDELLKLFKTTVKWGTRHFTMLRYIDFSVTIEGLHRGGTDDLDSHAKRMDNRIIRSSTRLADYTSEEISEWYEDKIIPTDVALAYLGITTPDEIEHNDKTYVRASNGYIVKGMEKDKDVKRGLYMLSLPMNFIFKINLTELAHVVKERDKNSTAAPELKLAIESLLTQIQKQYDFINRELFYAIPN